MKWLERITRAPAAPGGVRLLPTLIVTLAALLGLKAVAVAQGAEEAAPTSAPAAQPAAVQTRTAAPAQCAAPSLAEQAGLSQSEVQVLQALSARRQQLDQRAVEIEARADLLAAAERRMGERLAELRRLEGEVGQMLGRFDEEQEQRMTNLVDVYQRMRAKDAAAVFDTLDETTLAEVAGRMRQQNLAEVMGRMAPERARRLTEILADRARPVGDGQALLDRAEAAPAAR
jgi:flagellar motility protein MotE (MotC chaperone)